VSSAYENSVSQPGEVATQLADRMETPGLATNPTPTQRKSASSLVPLHVAAMDEEHLVRGIAAKDPKAVAQLYDLYAPLIRGLLARTLGETRDVDDLTQDSFITVIDKCQSMREPSLLRSFVVGVTFRIARNHLRKRALRRFLALEEVSEPAFESCDPECAERVSHIYAVLDQLDSDSRLCFVARHVEGYGLAEAAELCNCSLATYKRRLARAEKRFEALSRGDPVLKEMFSAQGREP
jgi:RNA polymerase sigma-70 factor, ECF subfamily